jgi:hypothetical protein
MKKGDTFCFVGVYPDWITFTWVCSCTTNSALGPKH